MANREHLAILKQGVEVWNVWRFEHPEVRPDLAKADLRNINLEVAVYRHPSNPEPVADPYGVDFTGALLMESDLSDQELWLAEFRGADLTGANLGGARIHWGNFHGASLRKANLIYAQLWRTDVTDADFAFALMGDTVLSELDLSSVRGLEQVDHRAWSVISIDTIVRSSCFIPQGFLRSCGLPDRLIHFLPALLKDRRPL